MKPKFLYTHTLGVNSAELIEVFEIARLALLSITARRRIVDCMDLSDEHIGNLESKIVTYLERSNYGKS